MILFIAQAFILIFSLICSPIFSGQNFALAQEKDSEKLYTLQVEIELPSKPEEVKILTETSFINASYTRLKGKKYLILAISKEKYDLYSGMAEVKSKHYFSKFKKHTKQSGKKETGLEKSTEKLQSEVEIESNKYKSLKASLVKYTGFNKKNKSALELERREREKLKFINSNLKRLIKFPRKNQDKIYAKANIASNHLYQVAKATAVSERTSKRRKKTALRRLKRQLNAIKSLNPQDYTKLSNELASLRKKRKKLENNLFSSQF